MPSIDISKGVKERLDIIKEKYSCKAYSEAVNILLLLHEKKEGSSQNTHKS